MAERAVLGWTEALTNVAQTHAPDTDFQPLQSFFTEAEIMSFPEWVALTILSAGQRTAEGLVQALADARVVVPGREMTVVDDLIRKELVTRGQNLSMTQRGLDLFQPLRDSVRGVTSHLVAEVSSDDLAVTRRVLETLTSRAVELLRTDDT